MNNEEMGHFIRERRKALHLTQKNLAEQLGISDKTVSKWERGAGLPDICLLEPLAEALQLDPNHLIRCQIPEPDCISDSSPKDVSEPLRSDTLSSDERPAKNFSSKASELLPEMPSSLELSMAHRLTQKVNASLLLNLIVLLLLGISLWRNTTVISPDDPLENANSFQITVSHDTGEFSSYNMQDLSCTIRDDVGNILFSGPMINDIAQLYDIQDYVMKPGYTMYLYPTNAQGFPVEKEMDIAISIQSDIEAEKTIGITTGNEEKTAHGQKDSIILRSESAGYFQLYIRNDSPDPVTITTGSMTWSK